MHRIRFAHQLRALAAFSVLISHLVGVFWLVPGMVADASATPPVHGPIPHIVRIIVVPWWQPGPFGVALFFLISGFVIPLSLVGRSPGRFLVARAVRVWPTFAVALGLDVLLAFTNGRSFGYPYTPGAAALLANLLLIPSYVDAVSVDLVNWTLGVEMRFYLLAAALARFAGGVSSRAVLAFGCVAAVLSFAWPALPAALHDVPFRAGFSELAYISFMLLGALFAAHHSGRLTTARAVLAIAAGLGFDALCWRSGPLRPEFPVVFASYAEALALFALCYAFRRRLGSRRPLDLLADISYPVYLLQTIVGFTVIKRLMLHDGWHFGPALLAAIIVVVALAVLLHVVVEAPTMRRAHAIGRPKPRAVARGQALETAPWR